MFRGQAPSQHLKHHFYLLSTLDENVGEVDLEDAGVLFSDSLLLVLVKGFKVSTSIPK